ncbi:hypothetical protein BMS3Bbin15_00649 [archaeon BMS3Bbin15]|nr:hypothetical protein BMS3Bbin15_00649 [archaeon BMS3Bbin15]
MGIGTMQNKRKMPGMLYILVSFIPWIVYWILCGMGNRSGVVIPFAISLLLVIPQIRKRVCIWQVHQLSPAVELKLLQFQE